MKTTIPFTTKGEKIPKYLYDINRKEYYLLHPVLLYFYFQDLNGELHNFIDEPASVVEINNITYSNPEEISYYLRKYLFLKSNNLFSERSFKDLLQSEINEYNVENCLKNLNNIVFEVTDACNLNCKYCGYGEMYYDHDERHNKYISDDTITATIRFLKPYISDTRGLLHIGFYGGEPLLNVKSIKKAIEFINRELPNREIRYTMTTNGILLDKYAEFLVENKFKLTISIDGNEINHSYRSFHSGKNSFNVLYKNLKQFKQEYPTYFNDHVNFNTVIHDRNSIEEVHNYLFKEFGKNARFSPLDDAGIRKDKMDEFEKMYNDIIQDLAKVSDTDKMIADRFIDDPNVFRLAIFLNGRINNTRINRYEDLFSHSETERVPGGACLPFQKKIFVTVNGKVLPCERINQDYQIGQIDKTEISIELKSIAEMYNHFYRNLKKQCYNCYNAENCSQCFFQIDDFDKHFTCHAFSNSMSLSKALGENISFLEKKPELLNRIIKEVILK